MEENNLLNHEDYDKINIDENFNETVRSIDENENECFKCKFNDSDGLVNFRDNILSTIRSVKSDIDADDDENYVDQDNISDTDSWANPLDIVPMWEIKDSDDKIVPIIDNSGDLDTSEDENESETDDDEEEDDCLTDAIESDINDSKVDDSKFLAKTSVRDRIESKLINMVGSEIFNSWMDQLNYFKNDYNMNISIDTFQLHPQPTPEVLMLIFKLLYLLDLKPI